MTAVYLAMAGEYSDFRVCHAFARREDAEAYKLGDGVLELEVRDRPVEVRTWYTLTWRSNSKAKPQTYTEYRDFDGNERHAEHAWYGPPERTADILNVGGWDLALVKKVYSEQRAQYLARKEGIA